MFLELLLRPLVSEKCHAQSRVDSKMTGEARKIPPARGRDIRLCGGLFLIVGTIDLIIIALFPSYALKLFGTVVTGPASFPIKLHSPAVHLLIGYGFLSLRAWAWGLAVAYSGFGVVSEIMNQLAFGFHPVRTGFIISTVIFVCYLFWRRSLFNDQPHASHRASRASQEAP